MTYILLFIALTCIGFYRYFKNVKKRDANPDLIKSFELILESNVSFYKNLDKNQKRKFIKKAVLFLERTRIEGVGTEINETDKILVAASAIIPIFNFGDWEYRNLTNVILYPDTFNNQFQFEGENRNVLGMVGTGFLNGQMLLSKNALYQGFSASAGKSNTAIHEFVHLLDKADGSTDGIPELLLQNSYALPWLKAMEQEIHRIKEGSSDINPYAGTNEAEFFAVVSEYFFKRPEKLRERHPQLFEILLKVSKRRSWKASMPFERFGWQTKIFSIS